MSWIGNLREAAYTSPDGRRVTFAYEDVSFSIDKKTSAYNFPDADGTLVQDLGHTGRQYPLRIILWGADYDAQAEDFEQALLARGIGKLEHPAYGTVDVVPYGSITRRDDLKTAGNQAIIEVTFWETINLVYPSAQTDPAAEVAKTIDDFNNTVQLSGLDTAVSIATFEATFTGLLDKSVAMLSGIANATDKVGRQFKQIVDSVRNNFLNPAILAVQTLKMLQSPARSSSPGRQDTYSDLMISIIDSAPVGTVVEEFPPRELYAMGAVTGTIITLINTQYSTKTGALQAADALLSQFDRLVTWRDNNYIGVDTGESYQKLQQAVALTAGYLVEISFTLKQERRLVLDRDRTIIDLAAELYGSVDDQLDFLINSNNLSGDEILELPRGREIVYYI